ncbi:MAG: hypothetical protein H6728_15860 [Myxococcales bacterium]|nr:hypothetical protein [Myxococcales bacterium]MCB9644549.1 hypothetical protein [Myxococcales bacterium]
MQQTTPFFRTLLSWNFYGVAIICVLAGHAHASGPDIPEPMVFDLVRGLGAKRGEIEVNALGQIQLHKQELGLAWAPEIEYAPTDNFAIELEIPILNTTVKALKFAAQGTFGVAAKGRFIHGIQGIVEYVLEDTELELTALYLFGYRFHRAFSIFCMVGLKTSHAFATETHHVQGILNPTIFFEVTPHLALGFETNLAYGTHGEFSALLMPQFQFRFGKIVALQLGVGARYETGGFSPHLAFRIVAQERLVEEEAKPKPTQNNPPKSP